MFPVFASHCFIWVMFACVRSWGRRFLPLKCTGLLLVVYYSTRSIIYDVFLFLGSTGCGKKLYGYENACGKTIWLCGIKKS